MDFEAHATGFPGRVGGATRRAMDGRGGLVIRLSATRARTERRAMIDGRDARGD